MIRVGKVTGSRVAKPKYARSSTARARILQVQIGPQLEDVQLTPGAGEDVNPVADSVVVILESGGLKFAVGAFDGIEPEVDEGERELYSSDGGSKLARLKLKDNSKAYLANASYDLRTALQTLIEGVQGATAGGNPIVDATGKIATALTQIQGLLDDAP